MMAMTMGYFTATQQTTERKTIVPEAQPDSDEEDKLLMKYFPVYFKKRVEEKKEERPMTASNQKMQLFMN